MSSIIFGGDFWPRWVGYPRACHRPFFGRMSMLCKFGYWVIHMGGNAHGRRMSSMEPTASLSGGNTD